MKFNYKARNRQGKLVNQSIDAPDTKVAKEIISNKGLFLVSLKAGKEKKKGFFEKGSFSSVKVKKDDLLVFNQQIRIIIQIGYPLLKGLKLIASQSDNEELKELLSEIHDDMEKGAKLSEAMGRFPTVFDNSYVNLVKSGESSGKLEEVFARISEITEKQVENTQKIKSATFYPKIVVFVMIAVFCGIVYFIVPRFESFFARFDGKLPFLTRLLVGTSEFMTSYWWAFAIIIPSGMVAFKKLYKNPKGRRLIDKAILKAPIIGPLIEKIEINTFCIILNILLVGGVDIQQALILTRDSMSNIFYRNDIETFIQSVEQGGNISMSMAESPRFPSLVTGLINIGEETGEVESVLRKISDYYTMQINYALDNLSKTIEPILLGFIFVGVLILALAIFMPLWQMNSLMAK